MKHRKPARCSGPIACVMAMLTTIAFVVTGCITPGGPASAPGAQTPSAAQGAALAPLEGGRQGFVIREVPRLDAAAQKDFEQAVHLLNEGEYDRAIDLLEKVVALSPGVTAPYINLALAYRAKAQADKAETHLKKALELVPEHPVACQLYGLLCREKGRFAEAREIYEKAVARYPDYYPVHKNLGILCDLYLNDPACALEHYQRYSEGKPEDAQVKLWIADLRTRLGTE